MAVGIWIATNRGLEEINAVTPYRLIDERRIIYNEFDPPTSFNIPLRNHVDMSGTPFVITSTVRMVRYRSDLTDNNNIVADNGVIFYRGEFVPTLPYGINNNWSGNIINANSVVRVNFITNRRQYLNFAVDIYTYIIGI